MNLSAGGRSRPRVALTEFKFSEECCRHAAALLTDAGVEVVPFHAQGVGERAMEGLIDEGLIDGVLDVVPAGLAEEILGGNRAAGPERLEAAGRRGIPQLVTPCGFDTLSCGPLERGDRGDPHCGGAVPGPFVGIRIWAGPRLRLSFSATARGSTAVRLRELELSLNSAQFAEIAVRELLRMLEQGRSPAESVAR